MSTIICRVIRKKCVYAEFEAHDKKDAQDRDMKYDKLKKDT